jgi:hypothetical protein
MASGQSCLLLERLFTPCNKAKSIDLIYVPVHGIRISNNPFAGEHELTRQCNMHDYPIGHAARSIIWI